LPGCHQAHNPTGTTARDTGSGSSLPAKPAVPLLRSEDGALTIIDKVIRAYGGQEKLTRWNVGKVKYKAKGNFFSPADVADVTLRDTFQLPGQFKRVLKVRTAGEDYTTTYVINKGEGWMRRSDGTLQAIDASFSQRVGHPFADFCNVSRLKSEGVKLSLIGEEKVVHSNTVVIRAESDEFPGVDFLYFDKANALMVKVKKRASVPGFDREGLVETFLNDYREIDGGMVPMRVTGYHEAKMFLDVVLLEVHFLDKIDDQEFAKP
jgi:hypothetical protein